MRRAALVMALVVTLLAGNGAGTAGALQRDRSRPEITVTELLGPDGEQLAYAEKINERGQVLASVRVDHPDPAWPDRNAVVWHRGTATRLGPAGSSVVGWNISERGHVVGILKDDRPGCTTGLGIPFRWHDGVLTELECSSYHGPSPWTINRHGDILGTNRAFDVVVWHKKGRVSVAPRPTSPTADPVAIDDRGQALIQIRGENRAAVWKLGRGITVLHGPGGARSTAVGFNGAGHVVGTAIVDGETHVVMWRDGHVVDLGPIAGELNEILTVNDRTQLIGQIRTSTGEERAFLWDDGRTIDLGSLGGRATRAVAVNDKGQVVGYSKTATGSWHAFLWDDGRMIDLTPTIPADGLSFAYDINDRGQIVGVAYTDEGGGAVMWTVSH